MIRKHLVGAAALGFFWMVGTASAAPATDSEDSKNAQPSAGPSWLDDISDQKLEAVDGSSLTLSSSDSGLSVVVTSPTGDIQKNTYALLSNKLGTISDGADGSHLIGVFRATDKGLEAQFADGHSESLGLNAAGGLSVTLTSAQKGTACMAWYPQGHAFSESERRQAVAEYARRLGVNDTSKPVQVSSNCSVSESAPKMAATPKAPVHQLAKEKSAANAKGLVPVLVRTSIVHAVDGAGASATAPVATAAAVAPKAPPTVSMGSMIIPASTQSPTRDASDEPVRPGHGASSCLSVDNDGTDLGFRNQCGFTVTFSYCLEKSDDPALACDAGSRTGNVAANGFVSILPDTNIKDADAEHEFRWVGCTGGASEVVPHLDKTEPPAGRCVRSTAS